MGNLNEFRDSKNIMAGSAGAAVAAGAAGLGASGDADAAPLSGLVAKAIRALPRTATKPEIEAAMLKADPKINTGKAATYAARAETLNRETSGMKETTELWQGGLGVMPLGHAEMGGYHVMLEHRRDLIEIVRAAGSGMPNPEKAPNVELLKKALDAMDAAPTSKDGSRTVGSLSVKIVKNGPRNIGTFYVVGR